MNIILALVLFPLLSCDEEDEDISKNSYQCKTITFEGVWYHGKCRDPKLDGVCGQGQRLFVTEEGVQCDCDEGWLRYEGKCYQEFSPAFCKDNKILNLGSAVRRTRRVKKGEQFKCITNPCGDDDNLLPHRSTWRRHKFCHNISELESLGDCELCVTNPDLKFSPLKCCTANNRKQCCYPNFIATAAIAFLEPENNKLKACSPESPCDDYDGDCTDAGDSGCDAGLVCGVYNCGTLVIGMPGSCCVHPGPSTYRRLEQDDVLWPEELESVPGGWSEWGKWSPHGGWGRTRKRLFSPRTGTPWYQLEEQSLY